MRNIVIVLASLLLVACTTTDTRLATTPQSPAISGGRVLIFQPDVQLEELLAAGTTQPKAEWSARARENLLHELQAAMTNRTHTFVAVDPAAAQTGRAGQVMRLHEAVGNSIREFEYGPFRLPTHPLHQFDWTLGEGAQEIGRTYNADYALFTTARGTYSSSGRMAMFIVAAAAGVAIPLGQQYVFTSLVDLHTGQVVWFNVALAGPDADMRSPEGARGLVTSVLQGAPL